MRHRTGEDNGQIEVVSFEDHARRKDQVPFGQERVLVWMPRAVYHYLAGVPDIEDTARRLNALNEALAGRFNQPGNTQDRETV